MGGRIWVESEEKKGSVFHFTAHFGIGRRSEASDPDAEPSHDVQASKTVSTPMKTAEESIAPNLATVEPIIRELTQSLEEDDTDAVEIMERLRLILSGSTHAEELDRLGQRINTYEFEEALEIVRDMAKRLKITF